MSPDDKKLLTQEICARLPHGVKIKCVLNFSNDVEVLDSKDVIEFFPKEIAIDTHGVVEYLEDDDQFDEVTQESIQEYLDMKAVTVENLIMYLRPLSSMTAEEKSDLRKYGSLCMSENDVVEDVGVYGAIHSIPVIEYLNSHHFDYRGLIEKGLAIPVTKKNNPYI